MVLLAALALASARVDAAEWHDVASLPHPRYFHLAAVGSDGRIYAFGGFVDTPKHKREGGLADLAMVAYDPRADRWTAMPPILKHWHIGIVRVRSVPPVDPPKESRSKSKLTLQRTGMNGGAGLDGRIYWFTPAGPVFFDPARGVWDQPEPPVLDWEGVRSGSIAKWDRENGATAVGPDGVFYLIGGNAQPVHKSYQWALHASVESYDPTTNTWGEIPPMPRARQLLKATFAPDGKLYVFGGMGYSGASIEWLESESEELHQKRVAEARYLMEHALDWVDVYDPATRSWSSRTPMPVGVMSTAVGLGADGRIYVVGGETAYAGDALDLVQVYDPRTDRWSEGPRLRTLRNGHAVAVTAEGKLYAIGGTSHREVTGIGATLRSLATWEPVYEGETLSSVEVLDTRPHEPPR